MSSSNAKVWGIFFFSEIGLICVTLCVTSHSEIDTYPGRFVFIFLCVCELTGILKNQHSTQCSFYNIIGALFTNVGLQNLKSEEQ